MTNYFYTGVLRPSVIEYLQSEIEKYPFVIEMARPPDYQSVIVPYFRQYPRVSENCMGREVQDTSFAYSIISKNFGQTPPDPSCFFCCKSQEEYDAVLTHAAADVVNPNPFCSVIPRTFSPAARLKNFLGKVNLGRGANPVP